ncbi:adenylosuccinate synthase [bacterium DOLJORAL78_65_58]|nr:MAG: adenylosuccinate synthase [bacterium DOLJORAL78_65_58]
MENRVIIGGQWGDEGKGKIVDTLGQDVDWVVRYQGGANAGHTIHIGKEKHVLHLVPSGVLHPGVRCLLGGGMVIDPWALRDEILALEQRGFEVRDRIFIASNAALLMPYHKRLDELKEEGRKRRSIGTTGRGIGPAYLDKVQRTGMRLGDLLLPTENLERKAIEMILSANELLSHLYEAEPMTARVLAEELVVLLPPRCLGEINGIFKAYCTRVGNGPFPTELMGDMGEALREAGGEYGATTGRARRCGWYDMVASRYAADINGMTGIFITKLDVLDKMPTIQVATAYELEGERLSRYPVDGSQLPHCRPVYTEFKGWEKDTSGCRRLTDLPAAARQYLEFLEAEMGTLIVGVSVGRDREQMIWTETGVTT